MLVRRSMAPTRVTRVSASTLYIWQVFPSRRRLRTKRTCGTVEQPACIDRNFTTVNFLPNRPMRSARYRGERSR